MADNTQLSAGTGDGDTYASDDIAGIKHQRVKISLGADGAATDALGGAGAVAAGVQRVTLASDDPAVTALQLLDNTIFTDTVDISYVRPRGIVTPNGDSAMDDTANAVKVLLTDAAGASLGVAAEYEDGATDASPSGTAMVIWDGVDTMNVVSPSNPVPVLGSVEVTDTVSLSRTVDAVAVAQQSDALMSGLTAMTPKWAVIDHASSGDNTVVSAVASNKIRVVAAFLVSAGSVNVRFESGASGTALTGQMNLVANTGFVLPYNPLGWFETGVNTLLNLELSAAVSVDGVVQYVEVA